MKTNIRREAALALLARTGIRPSTYAPLTLRLFWILGFNVRPPHFASFFSVVLVSGSTFAITWGALMWLLDWRNEPISVTQSVISSAVAGLAFGIVMARSYASSRRKHKLPSWNELP